MRAVLVDAVVSGPPPAGIVQVRPFQTWMKSWLLPSSTPMIASFRVRANRTTMKTGLEFALTCWAVCSATPQLFTELSQSL